MSQKVLVIDDSLAISKLAENVLSHNFAGVDVLVAQRGAEAFDRFNLAQPDIIVMNDTMPDMEGEAICYRLLNDPATSGVPVIVLANNGHAEVFETRYKNVLKVLPKPPTPESLLDALASALSKHRFTPNPAKQLLFYDANRMVYSGHTGFFSLRQALHMAQGERLTGVLRLFLNRFPIELFVSKGQFLFTTTRNFALYCRDSHTILTQTNLGTIVEAQLAQHATGCPIFLYLSMRGGFAHEDVVQIVREHSLRLFSNLWAAGAVSFEFEELSQFPDYVRNFPPTPEDPDNWSLASLRYVKFESLATSQRPDPNGSPAYTRKGYELVQRLKLNDVEARFATAVNGAESLQNIARKLNITLNDALLIVFRFQALEIIDYWSSTVFSLPTGVQGAA
jgi:CheY-like chemotaxis protein